MSIESTVFVFQPHFLLRHFCRLLTVIGYFSIATVLYHLTFDKRLMNHPKFMKNQIWKEIKMTTQSTPVFLLLATPLILLQVRGYAKLYDTTADGPGLWYNILQIPLFLLFADYCAYWIHRFAHLPRVYKHFLYMHKLHHRFIITTPYAAQATHPIEAFSILLPLMIFPYILPLQKVMHIVLIAAIQLWNVCTHEGKIQINGRILSDAASHSLHHRCPNCNYGHFFTIFDRLHGTYRKPANRLLREKRWVNEIERENEPQRGAFQENRQSGKFE